MGGRPPFCHEGVTYGVSLIEEISQGLKETIVPNTPVEYEHYTGKIYGMFGFCFVAFIFGCGAANQTYFSRSGLLRAKAGWIEQERVQDVQVPNDGSRCGEHSGAAGTFERNEWAGVQDQERSSDNANRTSVAENQLG